MKTITLLLFIYSGLFASCVYTESRDETPLFFKVGDCLIQEHTDIWQNDTMAKVYKIGRYSYLVHKLSRKDNQEDGYIEFCEQFKYATIRCSERKNLAKGYY